MIEQSATVLRIDNENVYLAIQRQTACGACSAKAGCGKSLLDNIFKAKPLELLLPNTLNVKKNDEVIVGLHDSAIVKASFYLYFFPLLCMIGSAILAGYIITNDYQEFFSIIGAAAGLFLGSKISRHILTLHAQRNNGFYQPKLLKVISKTSSEVMLNTKLGV